MQISAMARRSTLALGYFLISFSPGQSIWRWRRSLGRLPFDVPEALGLFVGYGFVLAAITRRHRGRSAGILYCGDT